MTETGGIQRKRNVGKLVDERENGVKRMMTKQGRRSIIKGCHVTNRNMAKTVRFGRNQGPEEIETESE